MSKEGNTYHKLYMAHSPEYQRTIARMGRMLTPVQVQSILDAHSIPLSELLDENGSDVIVRGGVLPDRLDAAMLYAWLGY